MAGFALVLTGFAALAAVFAWLVLSTPEPVVEPEPEPTLTAVWCECCGTFVRFDSRREVVTHLVGHAEDASVTADFTQWERELTS